MLVKEAPVVNVTASVLHSHGRKQEAGKIIYPFLNFNGATVEV